MSEAAISIGVHDIAFPEYHALKAWGSGALRAMRRGPPARVLWERDVGSPDTDATILGSAVHCALLTPDLYRELYAVKPEGMTFASREGKAWKAMQIDEGREILSFEASLTVERILEALRCKVAVRESLEVAESREASLLWKCSITGEMCKGRPDWMQDEYNYDLKVSRHAGGGALAFRAFVDGWMHQSAHYRTGAIELGLPIKGGRLVVVEPTLPHFVYTLEIKRDALDLLEIENIDTLKALRECRTSGVWPGTPDSWVKIEPPASANMGEFNDVVLGEEEESTDGATAQA